MCKAGHTADSPNLQVSFLPAVGIILQVVFYPGAGSWYNVIKNV